MHVVRWRKAAVLTMAIVKPKKGDRLSRREVQVLGFVAKGFSNKLIADELGISAHTAKFHVINILIKVDAACRTEAAVRFVRDYGFAAIPA